MTTVDASRIAEGVQFARTTRRSYGLCETTGIHCTVPPVLGKASSYDGKTAAVEAAYCSFCPYRAGNGEKPENFNPISFRSKLIKNGSGQISPDR